MTSSCPAPDPLSPAPTPPRPLRGEPGTRTWDSYVDGSVSLDADLGITSRRLVDVLCRYTRESAILTSADVVDGVLQLTFTRPA
ncbi:hypothetical protein FMEAI12_3560016 [Parafrankia sp. Ea1.12]|uniref:hypothetical protein n=1 Tax=Parafrankia sp. Ea1.12 TaxID=573499 RepID=UPI000DA5E11C|nr:hypothetical protein [Parafrankia sp. Ea1.12]SQD96271.1 hypothetical protein FMEAI12_3560016 [Parafrankia sp. Ea1.12]